MTKQDTIHDEELFSAKSMLNYLAAPPFYRCGY